MTKTETAPKFSVDAPLNPAWLQELRELVQANVHLITVFDNFELDILVRLPLSKCWRKELNDTARNVLFDEYEVVFLDDLEEDGQETPDWLQTMRQCGSLICHTPEMNNVIETLLCKLDGLSQPENHSLTRIIELTCACLSEYRLNPHHENELGLTAQGLRGLSLWSIECLTIH